MLERGLELGAASVNAAPDRAELDAERGGDLLVGEPFDVAENDGGAEVRVQAVKCRLDVGVEDPIVVPRLRRRLTPGQPLGCIVGETFELDPLLTAHRVEKEAGRN